MSPQKSAMLRNITRIVPMVILAATLIILLAWPYRTTSSHNVSGQHNPISEARLNELRKTYHLPDCHTYSPVNNSIFFAHLPTTCLANGKSLTLGELFNGKLTIINFWAYWCQPCITELPLLEKFSVSSAKTIRVILVHEDPAAEAGLTIAHRLNLTVPIITDSDGAIMRTFGLPHVIPESVIVAPDGSIHAKVIRPFRTLTDIHHTVGDI